MTFPVACRPPQALVRVWGPFRWSCDGWPSLVAGSVTASHRCVRDIPDVSFLLRTALFQAALTGLQSRCRGLHLLHHRGAFFTGDRRHFGCLPGYGWRDGPPNQKAVPREVQQQLSRLPRRRHIQLQRRECHHHQRMPVQRYEPNTNAMTLRLRRERRQSWTSGHDREFARQQRADLIGHTPGLYRRCRLRPRLPAGLVNVPTVIWLGLRQAPPQVPETATVTVTPASTSLSAGTALSVPCHRSRFHVGWNNPHGYGNPLRRRYTSSAETLASGAYTFAIPANSLSAGSDVLTVTYSGDSNYATATGTAT